MCALAKTLRPILASRIEQIPAGTAFDFILDILPVISSNWIIYAYWLIPISLMVFIAVTKFYYNAEDFPYCALVYAIAMLLTDILFTVTILGPPANFTNSWFAFDFNKDLFPSMHVGAMWLGLLLSDRKWIKIVMLVVTLVMSAIVLLMHTHYTIDVLGAIFIFYGVFAFSEKYIKNILRRAYLSKV